MEKIINIHVEKLPEGVYLANSEDVPGLVTQGRTAIESLEIAREVARKLIEARAERSGDLKLSAIGGSFDYPLSCVYSMGRLARFDLPGICQTAEGSWICLRQAGCCQKRVLFRYQRD